MLQYPIVSTRLLHVVIIGISQKYRLSILAGLLVVVFYQCSIKVHDLNELKEVYAIVDVEEEKGMYIDILFD